MSISAIAALALAMFQSTPVEGPWRAWLDCPGGELPFGIEIERENGELRASWVNGTERIDIPGTSLDGVTLVFDMPHYDSRIEARVDGGKLEGTWRKRRGLDEWTEMDFHARRGELPRFHEVDVAPSEAIDGRWRVQFDSSEDHAVGEFKTDEQGRLEGTFLTTTGDYRFLAGDFVGGELRLSCFDGAHAFLFNARLLEDGSLAGDFWSRDTWHENWTAVRDADVVLDDAFEETRWTDDWSIGDVVFPDLDGNPRSLADPEFAGKARILQVFGSWCPNCNDEARYLSELEQRYGSRGLSVLGLAFELTGDHARDAEQVRRYQKRNDVSYPVLIAGTANKEGATRAFPALDLVRSYPTTIFLRQDGSVRAVHTGFTGPATGREYEKLREEFEGLIEELLEEPAEDTSEVEAFLDGRTFLRESDERQSDGSFRRKTDLSGMMFSKSENGGFSILEMVDPVNSPNTGLINLNPSRVNVHISGTSVLVGRWILRYDREAKALLRADDFGTRYLPWEAEATREAAVTEADALALIEEATGVARRERIYEFTKLRLESDKRGNLHVAKWLDDESLHVELAAIWSAGVLGERSVAAQLIERLKDPNASVRRESVIALDRFGIDEATRSFVEPLSRDPHPFVREAVRAALAAD